MITDGLNLAKFKKALAEDKHNWELTAEIALADYENTVLIITDEELLSEGFSMQSAVSSENTFDIGAFIIGSITLTINNIYEDYTVYDFIGANVNVTLTLRYDDGSSDSIQFNEYTVDDTNDDEAFITLTCLDNACRFEKDYSYPANFFPATIPDIVEQACADCGVNLGTFTFYSEDEPFNSIAEPPTGNGVTYLKVISWCAQMCGCFARINNQGELIFGWYNIDSYENAEMLSGAIMDADYYPIQDHADETIYDVDHESAEVINGSDWSIDPLYIDDFHHVVSWGSLKLGTDDVVITGVKVVTKDADGNEEAGFFGELGYVLEIADNELISTSQKQNVAAFLGRRLEGLKFRTFTGSCIGDPTIEPGDLIWITGKKNRNYRSLICGVTFGIGQYQNLYCGAYTPARNSATSYSATTRAIVKARLEAQNTLSSFDSKAESMTELIARGFGMYITKVEQQDGSVIPYIHDMPSLEDSIEDGFACYMTSQGALMQDKGETTVAVTRDGNALVQTLTARGIDAGVIKTGELVVRNERGDVTLYVNCETGEVRITPTTLTLTSAVKEEIAQTAADGIEIGGRNLLLETTASRSSGSSASGSAVITPDYRATGYGTSQLMNEGKVFTVSGEYTVTGNSEEDAYIVAYCNGTEIANIVGYGESSAEIVTDSTGSYKRAFALTNAQAQSLTRGVTFELVGATDGAVLSMDKVKLEVGSKATDWTIAPEDTDSTLSSLSTAVSTATSTANSANTIAQQALDIASSAGGLVAYLDNDFQLIPTNADGTYDTFPTCTATISVFDNSTDVTALCTYSVTASAGITGSWNLSTKTYTVTGLSTDTGRVEFTVTYNTSTITKRFSLTKLKQSEGSAGTIYSLNVTPASVKLTSLPAFVPSSVTAHAYTRQGDSAIQNDFTGYITVQACFDGGWSTNLVEKTLSTLSFNLAYTSAAGPGYNQNTNTVTLPSGTTAIRIQLRESSSSSSILDQQEIIVVVDAESLTQQMVYDKLTNNSAQQGLILSGGKLYMNASYINTGTLSATYIRGGTLTLGGNSSSSSQHYYGNGSLEVKNASGNTTVTLNNLGISAVAGTIGGWKITSNSIRKEVVPEQGQTSVNNMLISPEANNTLSIGAPYEGGQFLWGSAPFRVTRDGKIHSTGGEIGTWTVTGNSLRHEVKDTSKSSIILCSNSTTVFALGAPYKSSNNTIDWANANFRVDKYGTMSSQDDIRKIVLDKGKLTGMHRAGTSGSWSESTSIELAENNPNSNKGNKNLICKAQNHIRLRFGGECKFEYGVSGTNGKGVMQVKSDEVDIYTKLYPEGGLYCAASELHITDAYNGTICIPTYIRNDGTVATYYNATIRNGIILY